MISLLVFACMVYACVYLVLLLSLTWVLLGMTMVFNLALPLPNSHGVMGFLLFGSVRLPKRFETEWGGLREKHKA